MKTRRQVPPRMLRPNPYAVVSPVSTKPNPALEPRRAPSLCPDKHIFVPTLILCTLGLVFLFSVNIGEVLKTNSLPASPFQMFRLALMQALWVAVGLVVMGITASIPSRFWQNTASLWLVLCVVTLALMHFTPLGYSFHGAERWIRLTLPVLGGVTIQPSEAFKLATLLWFATLYARAPGRRWNHTTSVLLGLWLFGIILVERQPDLGTAGLIFALGITVAFLGGACLARLGLLLCAGILGTTLVVALPLIKSQLSGKPLESQPHAYRFQRILVMLDPWSEEQGMGYQMVHAQLAVGSGGLTGLGLGMGREKRYLPASESDYIFATIAEETGFLGGLTVTGLLAWLVYACFQRARRAPTRFGYLFVGGLALWIALSALVNIGMALGILPTVGLPLPFLSAGGSALVSLMAGVGITQSIAREGAK